MDLVARVAVLEEKMRSLGEKVHHNALDVFTDSEGESLIGRVRHIEEVIFSAEDAAHLEGRVSYLEKEIARMEKILVTKTEFFPVKLLVFGAAGIMLAALIGGLIKLVIK